MDLKTLKATIEAVLFAYAEPLSSLRLAEILETEPDLVEKLILSIRDDCETSSRGVQLIQLEGSWQFATKANHGAAVQKALDNRRNTLLTSAALEALAIIAYNQPVSRSFIEQVRGVDSSSTVANLVEKGLIVEAGRLDLPGRPIAFRTTDAFLRAFGISSLNELPPLHKEESYDNEAGMYELPPQAEEYAVEDGPATQALRGGVFIEAEGGAAAMMGEDE